MSTALSCQKELKDFFFAKCCFILNIDLHVNIRKKKINQTNDDKKSLKRARSYFLKLNFVLQLKDHHTKDVNLKFQLNWSNYLEVGSNSKYSCCLYNYYVNFIMVTITRRFFH